MSKYLVKILSMCALVVMLCVSVVGATILATEAVGYTLTIFEDGKDSSYNAESNVSITVGGKKEAIAGTKVTVGKYTEITVKFEGDGYNFLGWYEGEYDLSRTKPESKSVVYKFELKKNTKLTAVRDVKTYNIKYVYDGAPSGDPVSYEFNQPLAPKPSTLSSSQEFLGWRISDEEGNPKQETAYTTANFVDVDATQTVFLSPAYDDEMVVVFQDSKGTQIDARVVHENEVAGYKLPDVGDPLVDNNVPKGYEFDGWRKQGGDANTRVESFEYDSNGIVLYMATKAISYNVSVKLNAISEQQTSVTYKITDGEDLAYNTERKGYTLVSATFDGNTYNYTDGKFVGLGSAIIEKGEKNPTVVAVWNCDYESYDYYFYGHASFQNHPTLGEGEWLVQDGSGNPVKKEKVRVIFKDEVGADNYDLQDKIYDKFMSGFTGIIVDGESVSFKGQMYISVGETNIEADYMLTKGDATFLDILSFLETKGLLAQANSGIRVVFWYE